MFSVRIVTTDYYLARPLPNIDVMYSDFRDADVYKVPVVRVYGATPAGQKTCMHVHGIFPYLYVPFQGGQPFDKFSKQLASSIDKALNVALGKASSAVHHVYKISLVSGIPFYGYHADEHQFLKIFLYNPNMVRKVADLLLGGGVMNKVMQPYESHIPYLLQLFIDYNLYGMNLLNVATVKFRTENNVTGSAVDNDSPGSPSNDSYIFDENELNNSCSTQYWHINKLPRDMILEDVEKHSTCELEVDVASPDILNRLEVGGNLGTNPGLAALWDEERLRQQERGLEDPITPPDSPDRGDVSWTTAEADLQERLQELILNLQPFIEDSESDEESQSFSVTPSSLVEEHLSLRDPGSPDTVILEEEESGEAIVNEESILRVVSSSQSFRGHQLPSSLGDTQDKSLIQMLASMDNETSPASSQQLVSQIAVLEEQDSILSQVSHGDTKDIEDQEEKEALDISQSCMQLNVPDETDEYQPVASTSRINEYDLSGMNLTWDSSQLLDMYTEKDNTSSDSNDDIPQFDGPADHKATAKKKSTKDQDNKPKSGRKETARKSIPSKRKETTTTEANLLPKPTDKSGHLSPELGIQCRNVPVSASYAQPSGKKGVHAPKPVTRTMLSKSSPSEASEAKKVESYTEETSYHPTSLPSKLEKSKQLRASYPKDKRPNLFSTFASDFSKDSLFKSKVVTEKSEIEKSGVGKLLKGDLSSIGSDNESPLSPPGLHTIVHSTNSVKNTDLSTSVDEKQSKKKKVPTATLR